MLYSLCLFLREGGNNMLENIQKVVTTVNGHLNDFIWGPIMLVFFLLVGLMFTVRTRVFQITHIKDWLDVTFLSLFKKRE